MRLFLFLIVVVMALPSHASRVKELVKIEGLRTNHLVGYGLVVGLDGQGDNDSARFTVKSIAALMQRQGVQVKEREIRVKNVAAVMVTSQLPPFAKAGNNLDVQVSSIGNAKSLQGGTLLMTRMKGADGKTYALAQGPVSVGGFSLGGGGGKVQKNHPTAGRVPSGATVERPAPSQLETGKPLLLHLNRPDFTTAARIARAINEALGSVSAHAMDPGQVKVNIPEPYKNRSVDLVAGIEALEVLSDQRARVVLNERTGTVVMGHGVRIKTVAISHGSLMLSVSGDEQIVQPQAFTEGTTATQQNTKVDVKEGSSGLAMVKSGPTLGQVVSALNALGVTTRDLIAILQAMRAAGALDAEIELL
ncbi:MAG TPA: flagellar biosynthesis protein FlgA [Myxococcales bacterium]|nr:flagellar biosynthesis protein FlgA [Myxococcales bacterium]